MFEKATGKKIRRRKNRTVRATRPNCRLCRKAIRELGWKRQFQKLENIVATTWGWHKKNPGSDPD